MIPRLHQMKLWQTQFECLIIGNKSAASLQHNWHWDEMPMTLTDWWRNRTGYRQTC